MKTFNIFFALLIYVSVPAAVAQSDATPTPNLERIKMATVGTDNVAKTASLYESLLNYKPVENGNVSAELARSWGAPAAEGRPYVLMQGASGDDVYLRAIEVNFPPDYKALNSYGWNAVEMIVEDPDAIYRKLIDSPFEHLAGPEGLGGELSTIRVVQFKGTSEEVFYFTTETGDRTKSTLLTPRSDVDRPFILVLAGPDPRALMNFYISTFGAIEALYLKIPVELIAKAQGLPSEHIYEIGLVRLKEFSNSIEIDGYPETTGPRLAAPGDLPPGVSMATFSVSDLNQIDPDLFISEPIRHSGKAYQGNRSATIIGPAGELIELIEEN